MIEGILSKLTSESILGFVPFFIKTINISFFDKYFIRFLIFVLISIFFVDFNIIQKYLFNKDGLILGFITIIHVYTSYKGYELLKGGVANSILYLYPLFILLIKDQSFRWVYLIFIIGLFLLAYSDFYYQTEEYKNNIFDLTKKKQSYNFEGILNMLISAITEAFIYFYILKIKTNNNWNHIFISYFIGLLLILLFNVKKIINYQLNFNKFVISLFYIFILLIGYYLRFYAINHLSTINYSILSYIGIFITYLYGFIFLKEKINIFNISGTFLIIIGNVLLYIMK